MTRLRALNESSSDDSEEENEERETIEAQEERAFSLYKKALELRQNENYSEAEKLFISLLNDDFLADVCPEDLPSGADGLVRPAVALKYACLKNLGNVLVLQKRPEDGLKCFMQAVELDESDITMWHQMGSLALQIDDFQLASQAFQEGLRCNANHWPCLDSLLPVLYALNDYLGCLLLVSRALNLDPEYPQALALRDQIFKEDPSLVTNFKEFFPDEIDVSGLKSNLEDETASRAIAHALSLQERYFVKNAFHSDIIVDLECKKVISKLSRNTWEELGKSLLQTYNTVSSSPDKSFLHLVEITTSESANISDAEELKKLNTVCDSALAVGAVDVEIEAVDVDSEQDGKGEDQTEEDATEASGLEEEVKGSRNPPQNSPGLKRKRKRNSTNLMDQWSKRRSGRRAGRKVEDREESNLASRFRSFLPETLLSKDLEAEIAKASKRRPIRDLVDDWGDNSMDTVELCRLLQERDAKDEHQRKLKQNSKETFSERLKRENYFETNNESSDVCLFLEQYCLGTHNIIELITNFIKLLAGKNSITWPSGLVPVYTEAYECMRKHIPFYSPFNISDSNDIDLRDLYASLLYCELYVDLLQQKNLNNQDILSENGIVLAEALGNVMLLTGLNHIFSSTSDQSMVMVRTHWLRVHLFLLQEHSSLAIHSLQDVLESLEMIEAEEKLHEKDRISKSDGKAHKDVLVDGFSLEQGVKVEGSSLKANDEKDVDSPENESNTEHSSQATLAKDEAVSRMVSNLLPSNQPEEKETSKLDPTVTFDPCGKILEATSFLEEKNNKDSCLLKPNQEDECMEICTENRRETVCPVDVTSNSGYMADECIPEKVLAADTTSGAVGSETLPDLKLEEVKHKTSKTADVQQTLNQCGSPSEILVTDQNISIEEVSMTLEPLKATDKITDEVQAALSSKDSNSPEEVQKIKERVSQAEPVSEDSDSVKKKQQELLGDGASIELTEHSKEEILSNQSSPKCGFTEAICKVTEMKEEERDFSSSSTSANVIPANEPAKQLLNDTECVEVTSQIVEVVPAKPTCHASSSGSDLCDPNQETMEQLKENCAKESKSSLNKKIIPTTDDDMAPELESNVEQIVEKLPVNQGDSETVSIADAVDVSKSAEPLKNLTNPSTVSESKATREEEEKSTDSSVTITKPKYQIFLPNCRHNQDINKRAAQKLLTSLTRQQQLSEVDDLYSSGQYEILASSLTECFKYCAQQTDCENPEIDNLPDRPTQMAMLLDSLWQLQRYSDCFYWTEACLHEAFNRYLGSSDSENSSQDHDDQQMWATTVERLLAGLNGCLKVSDLAILNKLPKTCLTRLIQTLTSILCQQLEQNDCSVEMAIECTTPWVILHRVIFFEEQELPLRKDVIPSHMGVLFTAHEYMGKKSLCWLNEGILLHLILDVVVPQIRTTELSNVRDKLIHEVEQAILCLYGHPKKTNDRQRKKLQDHKVHQHLDLTWERSLLLLKFFEPDELPCFDSTTKISPDEEQLFLRILSLVPIDCSPKRYLDKMKAYLEGTVETFPDIQCSIPKAAENLYYLLADYYLKTFKWDAAIRFYMLDVCINPHRFDSWAGMALARSTQMFHDINSCDTLNKDRQLCRKRKAQQCFQVAVDLVPENTVMLIEYGNFAYTVHSFCSRLLKTETDGLSMEMFTKIEEEKDKMLAITEKCFKAAERLDHDERWLQQFMLGKVAEKRGERPMIFLQHYRQAARLLFESNAEYPLSLNYDPPQHYAFEAHEVHYRLHASILKSLEQMEGKILSEEIERLYKETLEEAAKSPFMAPRATPQLFLNSKRVSLDPLEHMGKKIKLDDSVVVVDHEDCKVITADTKSGSLQSDQATIESHAQEGGPLKERAEVDLRSSYPLKIPSPNSSIDVKLKQNDMSLSMPHTEQAVSIDPGASFTSKENSDLEVKKKSSNATHQYTEVESDVGLVEPAVVPLSNMEKNVKSSSVEDPKQITVSEKPNEREVDPSKISISETAIQEAVPLKTKDSSATSNDKSDSSSASSGSSSSDDSSSESENSKNDKECQDKTVLQDSSKSNKQTPAPIVTNELVAPSSQRSSDHTDLINQCLVGIEECLVRYPRHYKSLYRLCHYYFHSKRGRNLLKCRQLLLTDYRVMRANRNININGLFKSGSINTMFNDVWRMPIDEIDRAGSFASHMSRCVHLFMELLRAQRDHATLLKLCIFLKRDPEKKDKKYLRDNERADLSKQALVLCLAAMRESVNLVRTTDNVIELFRTAKDGIKEMPQKEGTFKTLLSDAYKKFKGIQVEQSLYDDAVNFCQSELSSRKAAADFKLKQTQDRAKFAQLQAQMQAQAQVQVQAQAQTQAQTQVQAQVQAAQAIQMGVNTMSSTLPFNTLQSRFPTGVNASLGNALASPLFLPQMPVYRGRGRPPKVQQQTQQQLHNAMMMAQMIGLANAAHSFPVPTDSSKPKLMKQQKQRRVQQPTTSGPSTVVSSIIKDRPALSITTLPNSGSTTTTTSSNNGAPVRTGSPYSQPPVRPGLSGVDILPTGQSVWQARPRHTFPRPMNTPLPGNTDPRSNLNSNAMRRDGPKLKSLPKGMPGNSVTPRSFPTQTAARSFGTPSQSSNPVSLLSRLPGLQVKQNPQQGFGMYSESQSKALNTQERAAAAAQQQLDRLQKLQMASSQSSKPAVSISKVSATSSQAAVDNNVADGSETKKSNDPNFDVIVLD
ncbi:calcineurin-binding protein cabin-1-like isoform X3 [Frankliniella occidentalis]|uniref:Calcineurin-binding protein cabin-1-like isoform X3 n=1 Tax=Frankliniella occidentalis TaxID=133901 RepID=A0A6J1RY47_FRAOC|nr:calcineurin-binding protein cabin-1-like isoform X3 [Frankliniella occidentalis]